MGQHALHGPPREVARGSEMVQVAERVGVHPLVEEDQLLQLVSVEADRNVASLRAYNHHLPAWQHLLGHNCPQATQKMALAFEHCGPPLHHLQQLPEKGSIVFDIQKMLCFLYASDGEFSGQLLAFPGAKCTGEYS